MKWANKKENFNIYNVAFFKKTKEKLKKDIIIKILMTWSTVPEIYRAKHTGTGNFRSFFGLSTLRNPKNQNFEKWKNFLEISSFYTCVPKITIIWCMVPEIQSETDKNFLSFWAIFCPFTSPTNDLEYQNFEKNEKNAWRYYPFIHTCVQ